MLRTFKSNRTASRDKKDEQGTSRRNRYKEMQNIDVWKYRISLLTINVMVKTMIYSATMSACAVKNLKVESI